MKKNVPKKYPLGNRTSPTLDTWKRLYKAVRIFYERRPWEDLLNEDLFAVIGPVSGQTGYCCVMGDGGMEYGMQVYMGDNGLRIFHKTITGEMGPGEMLQELRCIGVLFNSKNFLDARDLAPIKKLLVPFKGNIWPQFRSYNPGYIPWYISDDEAQFLAYCLEQAVIVADEVADNCDFVVNEGPGGKILFRISEISEGIFQWKSQYRTLTIPDDPIIPQYEADEFSVAVLARKPVEKGTFWEVDCIPMPAPIMDTEPPRLPRVFVCVESKVGLALGHEIFTVDQDHVKLTGDKILDFLKGQEQKPSEIHFCKPYFVECLSPFLKTIGVKPKLVDKLAILAEFEEGMNQHLSKSMHAEKNRKPFGESIL